MQNDRETQTVKYYGKKSYRLNPCLAFKKPIPEKAPDYNDNESESNKLFVKRVD